MRKIYLFLLVLCSVSTSAFQTTLTSSIYTKENKNYIVPQVNTEIPTTIRRVQFINKIDQYPQLETALTATEYIFSAAMKSKGIDLVNIEAEVLLGDRTDFDIDELCKVSVYYADSNMTNANYPFFQSYQSELPVLVPKSIYNQCRGFSSGPCMEIKLNPQISYYFGQDSVPEGMVDITTVLLRALVIGCGIRSTLDPNTMRFGMVQQDGRTYISLFDTHIYNDMNATYHDVAVRNVSAADFLGNRTIYVNGYCEESNIVPIQLYNDWELGIDGEHVSNKTLNTINSFVYTENEVAEGFYDLLDPYLKDGIAQRTITPYTMTILQGLGWRRDLSVGFDDDFAFLRNSTLCCSSTVLRPDQTYQVWLSESVSLGDFVCNLQTKDSVFVVATGDYHGTFSFHTIPEGVQWKRNPITKNIIGQIHATAHAFIDQYIEMEKTLDIEIPYKPNKPIVQTSETATDGNISLHLNAFANGSDTYTITYTGITYNDTHTFTTTATALDTILTNIPGNQLYDLSVYGTNNEGKSALYTSTFGSSARPKLNMTISVSGNTLKYDLSGNGTIDISNVIINSVQITNQSGLVMMNPTAGSGEPINISSLTRGYYVITVIADGTTYSRMFIKR